MKTYTVKEFAKAQGISASTARNRLTKMVQAGAATVQRCWQENPKKYFATYSGLNLPGQWFNRYSIGSEE